MSTKGKQLADRLRANVGKVIIGKEKVIEHVMTAMIAGGHVLLEDVPGTGKTKLAKALAKSVNVEYARIQFTPDLLPTDITGLNIFDREQNSFVLRKGPVFTNVLLADEINRATPRTQSGLLESMEERQVSIDGDTYRLPYPFFVIATQNPIETTGTFVLPEAQLDRFLMRLSMGLPEKREEVAILNCYNREDPLATLEAVVTAEELEEVRKEAEEVFVHSSVMEYIVEIVSRTREDEAVIMGVSPRGSLALLRAAKVRATLYDRTFVTPDDVKELAVAVLSHRIVQGYAQATENERYIENLVKSIPVPTEDYSK